MAVPTLFRPVDMDVPRLLPQRGSPDELGFVAAVAARPQDRTVRLVFADWLDEAGRAEEAAVLRNPLASPIVTPFRVLRHWGAFLSGTSVVFVQTSDEPLPEVDRVRAEYPRREAAAVGLYERLEAHRLACHWFRVQPHVSSQPDALVLTDAEARLAGIDRLPG